MSRPESGWYMSSTPTIAEKYNETIGVIQNIGNLNKGFYTSRLESGVPVCLDNQVFTNKFNIGEWLKALDKLRKYQSQCVFIVIPDVIWDGKATLAQFSYYRNMVIDYPVALVSQDGISNYPDDIPWDYFDCLFVGGTDHHKMGKEGGWVISEAKKRGKWIHIGRVNSVSRMMRFWTADSWDGTHLGYNPSDAKKFHETIKHIRLMKKSIQFDCGVEEL